MYNRNQDFANLIDQIDAHIHTGDTLFNATNLERLRRSVASWERAIKSQDHTNEQIEQDHKATGTEPNPVYYYAVTLESGKTVHFESERIYKHEHAIMMQCRSLELIDGDTVKSFNQISIKEYWDEIFQ